MRSCLVFCPRQAHEVHCFVITDGPLWTGGYPTPKVEDPGVVSTATWSDPTLSDEAKFRLFKVWVASYYHHPSLASRSVSGITVVPSKVPSCTYDTMTPEEEETTSSLQGVFHSDNLSRCIQREVFEANRVRTLSWNTPEEAIWKDVPIKLLCCEHTIGEIVASLWAFEDTYEERKKKGGHGRKMEFHLLKGANHFVSHCFHELAAFN